MNGPRPRRPPNGRRRLWLVLLLVLPVGPLALLAVRLTQAGPPPNLGIKEGRLADCPSTPNCVSTRAEDSRHHVDAIPFDSTPEEALRRARAALESLPRTVVVNESDNYLHAEAKSLVFGFIDDFEVQADLTAKVLHVRSASRVGHSDLGVNRTRFEAFRATYAKAGPAR